MKFPSVPPVLHSIHPPPLTHSHLLPCLRRIVVLLGSLGASLVLSKGVLAGPALLFPLWSPWIRAGGLITPHIGLSLGDSHWQSQTAVVFMRNQAYLTCLKVLRYHTLYVSCNITLSESAPKPPTPCICPVLSQGSGTWRYMQSSSRSWGCGEPR